VIPLLFALALSVQNGRLVDERGGVVVLRGINAPGDAKVPPFATMRPEDMDHVARWGMNSVRLLFTWEAYEPMRGHYDEAYLSYYEKLVLAAEARGIHVIVDFHQDAFSRWNIGGCGEGMPEWMIPEGITRSPPDNGPNCANWGARMLQDKELHATWDAFYADPAPWLAMIARVANKVRGHVAGYDLLNEPDGDEKTQILPLYEKAVAAIDDPKAIYFLCPRAIVSAGAESEMPKPSFANAVYAPHFYDGQVVLLKRWGGLEPERQFAQMQGKAAEWGAPMLLGEFGAPGITDEGDKYLDAIYRRLDMTFASGTQWNFTPRWTEEKKDGWNAEDFSVWASGSTRSIFRPRAYPARIGGEPVSFKDDGTTFELVWKNDPARGETVVRFPEDRKIAVSGCEVSAGIARCSFAEAGEKKIVGSPPAEKARCGLTGLEALLLLLLRRKR
jgi:endoglycosylceramidase